MSARLPIIRTVTGKGTAHRAVFVIKTNDIFTRGVITEAINQMVERGKTPMKQKKIAWLPKSGEIVVSFRVRQSRGHGLGLQRERLRKTLVTTIQHVADGGKQRHPSNRRPSHKTDTGVTLRLLPSAA